MDLESHLEALLGEIEATQVEVEAESVRADEATPETEAASAEAPTPEQFDDSSAIDSAAEPEVSNAEDSTLEAIAEIESDLGDLVEAIYDLEDGNAEPLSETPVVDESPAEAEPSEPEPEGVPDDLVDDHESPEASDDDDPADVLADEILSELDLPDDDETPAPSAEGSAAQPDEDDGFGMALDDLAGSIEQMLAGGAEESVSAEPEPVAHEADDQTTVEDPAEDPVDELAEEAAPAEPEAEAPAPSGSGDSLDDMLAAASEELLADEVDEPVKRNADVPERKPAFPDDDEPEADASIGEELLDAVEQLAGDEREEGADPGEVAAGVVEIPGAETPAAPEPDASEPAEPESETPVEEAPEPTQAEPATVETVIPAEPEPETLATPTGRLAPLIIAWRATRKIVEPAARKAAPVVAEAVLAVGKPLREKPKSVRDTVGWIAIYTAFLALCLWIFALGFRSPSPPDVGDSDARVVMPEGGAPQSPVP